MYDIYQKFETAVLTNGLTVHCLHWPERAGVRFEFIIHSGSRHDPVGKEGVAHFMEHLVSENTLISADNLRRFFEHNAGEHPGLGSTNINGTCYRFLSSAEPNLLSQSLEYYGHMLLQASLRNAVGRERQVILGEYDSEYPMSIKHDMQRRMRDAAFANTFFARSLCPLGSKGTIARITQSDAQEFYDTHYTPANMSVVVVGELTLAQAVKALEHSPFGENKPGVRTPFPTTITTPPLPTETECRIHEGAHYVGTQSASFMSIAQLPGTLIPTQVWIVHEMIQTQLFKTVRLEKAWTYHIGCRDFNFGDFYEFAVTCSSLDVQAMDDISQVVDGCIEAVRLQSDLFEETKHKLVVSKKFSDPAVCSVSEAARYDLLSLNRIVTLTEELREAESVQLSDIYPVLDSLVANRRWTMVGYP